MTIDGENIEKLLDLLTYQFSRRQLGYSSIIKFGAEHAPDKVLLFAHDYRTANALRQGNLNLVPVNPDNIERVYGVDYPMVVDNEALRQLFSAAGNKIIEQREEIARLHTRLESADDGR